MLTKNLLHKQFQNDINPKFEYEKNYLSNFYLNLKLRKAINVINK